MQTGMSVDGIVTTSDYAAAETCPEVDPRVTVGNALFADVGKRLHR